MKKLLCSFGAIVLLVFCACKKEATYGEQLTAEWNSTAVKIDGVAAPTATIMFLHLQTGNKFEITTNISPFTHPTSGTWSADEANAKLTLSGTVWTIHHLESNTLRIGAMVDGRELEIDFAK
ncbi:MAG: hypothetical protein JNN28_08760 [Saprospiraceae bacterium]|nr:hypothetical protein [Saprospiraceae bacterium]